MVREGTQLRRENEKFRRIQATENVLEGKTGRKGRFVQYRKRKLSKRKRMELSGIGYRKGKGKEYE